MDIITYALIKNASGGGGGTTPKPLGDVNLIDYDGTVVEAYTASDFLALTALPSAPAHEGLTSKGWNWTLADAKTYVTNNGALDIGSVYDTPNGETLLHLDVFDPNELTVSICFKQSASGAVEVDWGDGSSVETASGTSVSSLPHTYPSTGQYTITLTPKEGTLDTLGTASSSYTTVGGYLYYTNPSSAVTRRYLVGANVGTLKDGLGSGAFRMAMGLKYVTLSSSITKIGAYAFNYCLSLSHITLPNNAYMNSADYAFAYSGLRTISFGGEYGSAALTAQFMFGYMNALERLTLPSKAATVGASNMFTYCYLLSECIFPEGLTSIQNTYNFNRAASLSTIVFPSTLTSIYNQAFADGAVIPSDTTAKLLIRFKATTPPVLGGSAAIGGLATGCKILFPYDSVAYLTGTNYPNPSTYPYIGFGTFAEGAELPATNTGATYNLTWHATMADATVGANPITEGNGGEVYCRHNAV